MKNSTLLFVFAIMTTLLSAQSGWERVISDPSSYFGARSMVELNDGSTITLINSPGAQYRIHLFRLDAEGNFLSDTGIMVEGELEEAFQMVLDEDGHLIIAGHIEDDNDNIDHSLLLLMKVNTNGDIIWEQRVDPGGSVINDNIDLLQLEDGYLVVPFILDAGSDSNSKLYKFGLDGTLQWNTAPLQNVSSQEESDIIETTSGNIILITKANVFTDTTYLLNIDQFGQVIAAKPLDIEEMNSNKLQALPDGGFVHYFGIIDGSSDPVDEFWLKKYDDNLNEEWTAQIGIVDMTGVFESATGRSSTSGISYDHSTNEILVLVHTNHRDSGQPGSHFNRRSLFRVNLEGEVMSTYYTDLTDHLANHSFLMRADDGSLYSCGYHAADPGDYFAFRKAQIVKYNSQGISLTNRIEGNLFREDDDNCAPAAAEDDLANWPVSVTAVNELYATLTDEFGNYSLDVGIGNYQVKVTPPSDYWTICNGTVTANFSNPYDTIFQNFGAQAVLACPNMWVDIGTPFLRNCFENIYNISYCNFGTIDESNAYISITLQDGLSIVDAELPYTIDVDGNIIFELGTVDYNICGDFNMTTYVDCDSVIVGETLCATAHIFPDSICNPNPQWSGASLAVSGECIDDDHVLYKIENVGTAPTAADRDYIVIEDHVIMFQDIINLEPGEIHEFMVPADGSTYRLEVEQEANHPGSNLPSVSIEGCGGLTPGMINCYSMNDNNDFIDVDCRQVVASYDPNDKTGFPTGYDTENYIHRNTELEYLIRFQNTGTDTAFTVVIRDTLSHLLDFNSVRPGSSSHPYIFSMENDGAIKFTFNNILLPDSTTNELASNGFVEFKVNQKYNNDIGSVIYNSAGIYFDFNDPVITNTTWHTIGEAFVTNINYLNEGENNLQVNVYPNPFAEQANFEISNFAFKDGKIELFDMSGRRIGQKEFDQQNFQWPRGNLVSGVYSFIITLDQKKQVTGKIVIQ